MNPTAPKACAKVPNWTQAGKNSKSVEVRALGVNPESAHEALKRPHRCPLCHSPRVHHVQHPDFQFMGIDDVADPAHPGMMECKTCGAITQWEP